MSEVNRTKRILSKAGTIVLCVVVVVAAVLLVFSIFSGNGRTLPGGYRPLTVLSGSMEPTLPVGSVVISKAVDPATIETGDIVTFAQTGDLTGRTSPFVTHRVTEVVSGDSGLSFLTKGDANNSADMDPVLAERVVGKVTLTLPYLGYVTRFVRSPLGLILMIVLPAAILIVWEGIGLVNGRKKLTKPDKKTATILILALAGAGCAGAVFGTQGNVTSAYFATVQSVDANFSTGTWEEPPQPSVDLTLSAGTAKAVRPTEVPPGPASFTIASIDEESGELKLDFGELHPGNTNNSVDVFRIKNEGDDPIEIDVVGAQGFEPFVVSVGQGSHGMPVTLEPGEEYSIDIKLGIVQGAAGDYTGVIRIKVTGLSATYDIPALVTVIDDGQGPEKGNADEEVGAAQSLLGEPILGGGVDSGTTTTTGALGDQSGQGSEEADGGDISTTTTTSGGSDPDGGLPRIDPEPSPAEE